MAKRKLALIFIYVSLLGAVVIVLFGWNVWRGLAPAIAPVPADIAKLIEQATSTTKPVALAGTNDTGMPLKLPPGYSISIYAKGFTTPRDLLYAPATFGGLLVSDIGSGKIYIVDDVDGLGIKNARVLISGLRKPHGMAYACSLPDICHLYVAEEHQVSSYTIEDNGEAKFEKKLFDLPAGGEHTTRSLLTLPNGRDLLVSIGSTCNVCHESDPRRAKIMIWDGETLKDYATGLRNSVFMTTALDGKVWATEMGRDYLGDHLPPDEINIIQEGKNYGWPNCYGQNIHDTDFDKNTYIRNPCMAPFETPSQIDLQAHSAPLGLTFFNGDLLVAYHGSWNRSVPTGYKIVRIKLDKQGNSIGMEDFITGWLKDGKALGRPVDIEAGNQGTLFITDDKAGVIYRVTPPR